MEDAMLTQKGKIRKGKMVRESHVGGVGLKMYFE
jgi:hypothetical protein